MKIDLNDIFEDQEPSYAYKKMKNLKKITQERNKRSKDLQKGRVIFMTPESIQVHSEDKMYSCVLKGTLKKELKGNKNRIACGDMVSFDSAKEVIVHLEQRHTLLMRQNPSNKFKEQILAANIDLLLITASIIQPALNPYLIDLYLLAAQRAGLKPVIVINKVDLLNSKKMKIQAKEEKKVLKLLKDQYKKLDIPLIEVSANSLEGFAELRDIMKDKASVFSGESGVGKSSLINSLGKSKLKVAPVSSRNKGIHTTTSSQLLEIESGGWCVDTPGIQSFGFKDIKADEVKDFFPEFQKLNCQFSDCSHCSEKGCGLKEALEKKYVSSLRLESYYKMLEEVNSKKP
ncbi:MAG: Small ribosomal subunit biogenesis GTPase RsgA [Chlamydiae bacterium]|nr:Small ribosomal subunit biogenesis GTPase RsgA [Chlamydiota bacterium]